MYNFIDNYIFLFKEYCNYIFTINTVTVNVGTFAALFLFGWLTSLNPCSLSIIPIYISYLNTETRIAKTKVVILFTTGIFIQFVLIGCSIIYFAQLYKQFIVNFDFTAGFLLTFIGLSLLNLFPFTNLAIKDQDSPNLQFNIYFNSLILGFSSGIITSACNIPILITLLTWLSSLDSYIESFFLSITYTLGYCLSIFIASLITKSFNKLKVFNIIISWGTSCVGAIMLSSGVFSLCSFFRI